MPPQNVVPTPELSGTLDRGHLVCVFPEGSLTPDGRLRPFRRGVEVVIRAAPVPVVPIAIRGMWGSYFSRRWGRPMSKPFQRIWSRVSVNIGRPIAPERLTAEGLSEEVSRLGQWECPDPPAIPQLVDQVTVSRDQFFPASRDAR